MKTKNKHIQNSTNQNKTRAISAETNKRNYSNVLSLKVNPTYK